MSEAQEKKIAELEREVLVAGEMMAQILKQTGPVTIPKGVKISEAAHIEVNFDPKGKCAVVELMDAE